jgi:hypothetical protein
MIFEGVGELDATEFLDSVEPLVEVDTVDVDLLDDLVAAIEGRFDGIAEVAFSL